MILAVSIMFSIESLRKKMVVSSAKILTLPDGQHIGKSLINNRKISGPRTEHWGTQQNTDLVVDFLLSI